MVYTFFGLLINQNKGTKTMGKAFSLASYNVEHYEIAVFRQYL